MHVFLTTILFLFTALLACAEAQAPIKGSAPERLEALKLGTSYYPELTDRGEWARDLDNMKSSSIRIIRMLEFAWTKLEPREGEYEFEWLDEFLKLAHERGMSVILCTPSATPPAWMLTQYPEILVVPRDGRQRTPGGRRDCDSDSFIYREFSVEMARRLGERYGKHPAVIGWQIDNELIGPEMAPAEIHSAAAQFRFRQWLKAKYGSVGALNAAWGTGFWSAEISDWGEITTPQNARCTMGHVLDYGRYFTHSQVEFLKLQRDALRAVISKEQWIGHNSTGVFDRGIDHVAYSEVLDVAGWDAYPGAAGKPHPEAYAALAHDMFRTSKRAPFWIFETSLDKISQKPTTPYWAEMVARGAKAIIIWHWREHRAGAENRSDVVCDYDGRPDEQRVKFLREFAARPEFREPLPEKIAPAPAAFIFSEDEVRAEKSADPYLKWPIPYTQAAIAAYEPLRRLGVSTDMIRPGDDLTPYKLLVMPSCRIFDPRWAAPLIAWVRQGGVLVATAKIAQQDDHGVYFKRFGEPLRELLGFEVLRDVRLSEPPKVRWDTEVFETALHAERIETVGKDCEVLARFEGGGLAGSVAALRRDFGKGTLFFSAATSLEMNEKLIRLACARTKITTFDTPVDLIVTPHLSDPSKCWIFNYGNEAREWNGTTIPAKDFRCLVITVKPR
ncbi:MAG: beta-galactosidase [Gloeobacteraceae cyanobacterium ES-bin-144]|nr:beta-galactosidase [Verrucomicrobiales bacterium]